MSMHFKKQAQIEVKAQVKAQIEALIFDETPIIVMVKYFDYSNVFSAENVKQLPEHTGINDYTIELEEDKQPTLGQIYSLRPIEDLQDLY